MARVEAQGGLHLEGDQRAIYLVCSKTGRKLFSFHLSKSDISAAYGQALEANLTGFLGPIEDGQD